MASYIWRLVIKDTAGDLKVSKSSVIRIWSSPIDSNLCHNFHLVPFSCHMLEIQKAHNSEFFVSHNIQLPKRRIHHHLLCTMQVDDYLSLEASVAQPAEGDSNEESASSEHHTTQLY